jgi:hypothetical protein
VYPWTPDRPPSAPVDGAAPTLGLCRARVSRPVAPERRPPRLLFRKIRLAYFVLGAAAAD